MYKYLTISTWAKHAGVTRASVYARLRRGSLRLSLLCEHPMIDTAEYPPHRRWKAATNIPAPKETPF